MLDLHKLRHFVTLCRVGKYGEAAVILNMSQSALSRSITSLEEQYSAQLLDRGRHGAHPTQVGQFLLHAAQILLDNAHEIEQSLIGAAGGSIGVVRFGVGPVIATSLLPQLATEIARTSPGVSLRVEVGPIHEMVALLNSSDLDFVIGRELMPSESSPQVSSEPLGIARPAFQVRPGHPLAGATAEIGFDDIAAFPQLSGKAWWHYVTGRTPETEFRRGRTAVEVDNYDILAEIALRSDAVLLTSSPGFASLVTLPLRRGDIKESVVMCHTLSNRTISPASQVVLRITHSIAGSLLSSLETSDS